MAGGLRVEKADVECVEGLFRLIHTDALDDPNPRIICYDAQGTNLGAYKKGQSGKDAAKNAPEKPLGSSSGRAWKGDIIPGVWDSIAKFEGKMRLSDEEVNGCIKGLFAPVKAGFVCTDGYPGYTFNAADRATWSANAYKDFNDPKIRLFFFIACVPAGVAQRPNHWVGCFYDPRQQTAYLLDSLAQPNRKDRAARVVGQFTRSFQKIGTAVKIPPPLRAYLLPISMQEDDWTCGYRVLNWLAQFLHQPGLLLRSIKRFDVANYPRDALWLQWGRIFANLIGLDPYTVDKRLLEARPGRPQSSGVAAASQAGPEDTDARFARALFDHFDNSRARHPAVETREALLRDGRWTTPYVWAGDTYADAATRPLPAHVQGWRGWDAMADIEKAVEEKLRMTDKK